MSLRKRLSALILMLALIVPVLAACGAGGTGDQPTPVAPEVEEAPQVGDEAPAGEAPAEEELPDIATGEATGATAGANGDITQIPVEDGAVIRFTAAGNPTEQAIYLSGIERFQEIFPNVTVNFEPIVADYETQMNAQFSAGSPPDVLLVPGQIMGQIGYAGLLLPLDEYMSQAGVQTGDYVDALIELYQWEGATYAIPKDFNPLVLFVNNQMAEEAGVDPQSIQTWDDLSAAAEAMTTGEGPGRVFGMCLNPDIERYGAAMLQRGNPIIEDGTPVFNRPEAVEAMEFWASFRENGTGELFGNLGRGWCGEAFAGRNTAIVMEGGWLVPFLDDPSQGAADLEYTAIPLPVPEGGEQATWLFTNGIGAAAQTQFPNAAAALVLYLTSEANQRALIPTGLAQPSLPQLADDPYYTENPVAAVLIEQGEFGQLSDVVLGGPLNKGDVVRAINQNSIEPIFLGAQEPQQALDAGVQAVEQVLQ